MTSSVEKNVAPTSIIQVSRDRRSMYSRRPQFRRPPLKLIPVIRSFIQSVAGRACPFTKNERDGCRNLRRFMTYFYDETTSASAAQSPSSCRGGSGTSQMGGNGVATVPAGGRGGGAKYAAELRILLVYLSENLGRLGQNGGPLGGRIFHWGRRPPWLPIEPPLSSCRIQTWTCIGFIQ